MNDQSRQYLTAESTDSDLREQIQQLLRRESLFSAAQRLARIGYCEWDYRNNRLLNCTPEYAEIYGLSMQDIMQAQDSWDNFIDQIHPGDRLKFTNVYRNLERSGSYEIEYRIFLASGEIRYLWEVCTLVEAADGMGVDSVALVQDITERKQREQELEKRNALVRQVETITDIGHFIWDLDTEEYTYISPGFARIHGVSVEQYLQRVKSWQDDVADVHEDDYHRIIQFYEENDVLDNDYIVEYRIVRPDGEIRWIQEQTTVMQDPASERNQSIGVLKDITEQKKFEIEMLETKDTLESLADNRSRRLAETIQQLKLEAGQREQVSDELETKNAELERFTYTVSHDLRTPLVTIKGFLGMLKKDIAVRDLERVDEDIDRIDAAATTMANLLNDLLELSRVGRVMHDPVTTNLGEIAHRAAGLVDTEAAGVKIEIEPMPDVRGDEIRLVEVFVNLLENAIKFMGDQPEPCIHIGAEVDKTHIRCTVADNGIGIAPEYQEQIFGLFERLQANSDNTGIGLALVKRIIEVHGGEIHVESAGPGRGSQFVFTLPH